MDRKVLARMQAQLAEAEAKVIAGYAPSPLEAKAPRSGLLSVVPAGKTLVRQLRAQQALNKVREKLAAELRNLLSIEFEKSSAPDSVHGRISARLRELAELRRAAKVHSQKGIERIAKMRIDLAKYTNEHRAEFGFYNVEAHLKDILCMFYNTADQQEEGIPKMLAGLVLPEVKQDPAILSGVLLKVQIALEASLAKKDAAAAALVDDMAAHDAKLYDELKAKLSPQLAALL